MNTTEMESRATKAAEYITAEVMQLLEVTGGWQVAGQWIVYGLERQLPGGFFSSMHLCHLVERTWKFYRNKPNLREKIFETVKEELLNLLKEKHEVKNEAAK